MISLHFVTVKTLFQLFQSRQKRRNSLIARLHETTTMSETCPSKTIEQCTNQCKSRFSDAADYQCVLKFANHTFKHFSNQRSFLFWITSAQQAILILFMCRSWWQEGFRKGWTPAISFITSHRETEQNCWFLISTALCSMSKESHFRISGLQAYWDRKPQQSVKSKAAPYNFYCTSVVHCWLRIDELFKHLIKTLDSRLSMLCDLQQMRAYLQLVVLYSCTDQITIENLLSHHWPAIFDWLKCQWLMWVSWAVEICCAPLYADTTCAIS